MNIAKYTASIGFKVNTQDIRKVDRAINLVENKMKAFQARLSKSLSLNITKFTVDQTKLNMTLGTALDAASPKVAFEISRFVVNDRALLAALLRAARRLPPVPPGPNPPIPPRPGPGPGPRPPAGGGGRRSSSIIGAGLMGPLGYGALALAGGGYGLGALNRRNQEVVAAQLQTQAVSTANGGTVEQGKANFEWLRNQANRVGFNYLQASGDFNTLTANIIGAGGTNEQARNIFKGFSEYGRVQKLSAERQKLVFNALSQVAGKDKLQAEELNVRLAA